MEKNKPLLSICIPTYNRCEYLKTTLKKLTQNACFLNSNDIEIIISDNYSNDETEILCREYAQKYPNKIKYIRQEQPIIADVHITNVLNYGNGKYLKLNNDNLYFKNGALEKIINLIKTDKVADILLFANGNAQKNSQINNVDNINTLIENLSYFITWIGAFCVKADVYKNLDNPTRFAYLRLPQVDIILRLIKSGSKVSVLNEELLENIHVNKKGANYNIAEVFGKNYLLILKEYLKSGELSKKVYEAEKKKILLKHINFYAFDVDNQFTFLKTGYFKYLIKDYGFNIYFYIEIIRIMFKKIITLFFCISSNETHKTIKILGIKIKLKRSGVNNCWRKANQHNNTHLSNIHHKDCVSVGNYSYGSINIQTHGSENEKLEIGNFVSIADNVKFILGGNHPYEGFSTYPFKVLFFGNTIEAQTKGPIIVKDDVWIGENALILSGTTLGQGCIVAAGSVVTKDIPPYAIVGGNPAKVIKYRFEQEIVNEMIKFDFSKLTKEQAIKAQEVLYTKLTKDNIKEILATIQG